MLNQHIEKLLQREGLDCRGYFSGREALEQSAKDGSGPSTLYILDYALPDMSADEFLRALHRMQPGAPFMIVTGQGSEQIAVDMMKRGAKDYLVKDGKLLDILPHAAARVIREADHERRLIEAEEQLRLTREHLRAVLIAFPIAIWTIGKDGVITFFAAPFLESHGIIASKLIGKKLDKAFGASPQIEENAARALAGEMFEFNLDLRDSSWDGFYLPLKSPPGEVAGALGVAINVSGRKKMEAQRRELEMRLQSKLRKEAIGSLASGLGHEINNPLNAIINYAQLIVDIRGPDTRESEFAKEIITEGEQIAQIVRTLSALSRQDSGLKEFADPVEMIHSVMRISQRAMEKDGIRVEEVIEPELPAIRCAPATIQQIFMALLSNARDALNRRYPGRDPDKILRISVSTLHNSHQGWVRWTIEDHGDGIPEEIREHIYDPFFTTRSRIEAKGLGLSLSYAMAREQGAEISFESERGQYTRFHLDLPGESTSPDSDARQ